ncbi:MAG TPA: zinc-binding dehydrogenase [Kofleriaceae bacterium]|nr:zinc-binding dehydrogenase [Kofleriaceae bacterium]
MPAHTLPASHRGLALAPGAAGGVELVERPLPTPARGQVLVRMHATPINPNDLMFLDGTYEVKKPAGTIAGFEGSGTVVATGGGMIARYLLGRDVACAAGDGDGTWAEYACIDAMRCAPLRKGTDPTQGAMLLTNPLTATVLLATARRAGHRAFVQNAAAGALGKMLVRLCARERLPLVNVVRRPEQAQALHALGAEHVVIVRGRDDLEPLRALCNKLGVRFAFDAIAGDATGLLADAIGIDGQILVYGMLSGAPASIDANALVFKRLRVEGFTMYAWLEHTSRLGQLRTLLAAQRRLADDLRSEVRGTYPLAQFGDALARAKESASEGKVLFAPRSATAT